MTDDREQLPLGKRFPLRLQQLPGYLVLLQPDLAIVETDNRAIGNAQTATNATIPGKIGTLDRPSSIEDIAIDPKYPDS